MISNGTKRKRRLTDFFQPLVDAANLAFDSAISKSIEHAGAKESDEIKISPNSENGKTFPGIGHTYSLFFARKRWNTNLHRKRASFDGKRKNGACHKPQRRLYR